MKKIVRLTESDLVKLVKRVINEQSLGNTWEKAYNFMYGKEKQQPKQQPLPPESPIPNDKPYPPMQDGEKPRVKNYQTPLSINFFKDPNMKGQVFPKKITREAQGQYRMEILFEDSYGLFECNSQFIDDSKLGKIYNPKYIDYLQRKHCVGVLGSKY